MLGRGSSNKGKQGLAVCGLEQLTREPGSSLWRRLIAAFRAGVRGVFAGLLELAEYCEHLQCDYVLRDGDAALVNTIHGQCITGSAAFVLVALLICTRPTPKLSFVHLALPLPSSSLSLPSTFHMAPC